MPNKKTSKIKWCFLLNQIGVLIDFLGKLTYQIIKEGDECIVVANSKIAEYSKRKFFPKNLKFFSKIDWCIKNYKKKQKKFRGLSWKEFFPTFDRMDKYLRFNYNDSVKIISQLYQFIDFVFQKEKPDVVINEVPANIFTEISYNLCKKYNIVYLGLIGSRIEGRIDLYDLEHTCSKYEKTFKELNSDNISDDEKKFARDFITGFLSHKQLPSYVKTLKRSLSETDRFKNYLKRERRTVRPQFQYFLKRKYFSPFDYESEVVFKNNFRYLWNALKRRLRASFQKNIYDLLKDDNKFFLFPLHLQPEASTSVLATYFSDQLSTIRNIAFSLPFQYKLYVKEHPAAFGTRSGDFYKKLKQIPNVVLVSHNENVENLVKRSQGLVTLTSTVGMESALAGKPVYVLGNVFYSYHPLCKKVNSFEELKQQIEEDLTKKSALNNLEDINIRFILSYFRNTIAGDIATASSENDTNNYKGIFRDIKRMFLE